MQSETSVFTVRLPVTMQKKLDKLADNMDRSRSWMVTEALQQYIEHQHWLSQEIRKGVEAADRGEFATEAQMAALFNKYKPKKRARRRA